MDAHCVRTCSYTIVIHYYDYKTLEHSDGFWGLGPIPSWRPCKVNKARASSSEDLRRSSKNDPTRISKHLKASLNDLRTWAYPSILNRGHLMSFPCRQILLARAQPRHLGEGMRTFWQLYPSEFVLRWRGSIAASDKRFNKQRAFYNAFHLFIMTLWHLVPYVLSYEDVLPHSCMYVCMYLYYIYIHFIVLYSICTAPLSLSCPPPVLHHPACPRSWEACCTMMRRFGAFFLSCILSLENCDSTLNLDEPSCVINPPTASPALPPWIAARLRMRPMLATLPASSLALVSLQADETWDDLIVVFVSDSWQIKPFIHSLSLCTAFGCSKICTRNGVGNYSCAPKDSFFAKRWWCFCTHVAPHKCAADAGILEHAGA